MPNEKGGRLIPVDGLKLSSLFAPSRPNITAFERGFSRFHFTSRAGPYDATMRRAAIDRLDMLATMFDTAFILPGTNVRFGVESLLRLVPRHR
jgi:hypothetical protein